MGRVSRFEELRAWKKARELVQAVYRITSVGTFSGDFGLRNQIRRAAVSVMSNIAEGFERGGDQEFKQFLAMAKGSAGEVRSQLYAASDAGHLTWEEFHELKKLALEATRLIAGLMRYLAESSKRGNKYRPPGPRPANIQPSP